LAFNRYFVQKYTLLTKEKEEIIFQASFVFKKMHGFRHFFNLFCRISVLLKE